MRAPWLGFLVLDPSVVGGLGPERGSLPFLKGSLSVPPSRVPLLKRRPLWPPRVGILLWGLLGRLALPCGASFWPLQA